MSKIFYDHLLNLEEVAKEINKVARDKEEKEELWNLVDEMVHHKVLGCILDKLDKRDHEEFLYRFHETPHSDNIITFLKSKIGENIEELIKQEIGGLAFDLLEEIRLLKNPSK